MSLFSSWSEQTGICIQIAGTLALSAEKVAGEEIRLVPGVSLRGKSGSLPLKHPLFHLSPATDTTGYLTTPDNRLHLKKHFTHTFDASPSSIDGNSAPPHLLISPTPHHPPSQPLSPFHIFPAPPHQMYTLHSNSACKLLCLLN